MNDPMPYLVSVIIPVYNVEPYIQVCIDSVLKQSYSRFEVIVVDDQSPDDSINRVKEFNDARIKVVTQENRGLSGARNTGIRHAKGEILAFLDSDDFWHPEKLERHVQQLVNDPEIGLSFSASELIDELGQRLNRRQEPINKVDFSAPRIFCRNPIGNGSTPVIRRSVLDQIAFQSDGKPWLQYFDESLRQSEDIDCWIRLVLQTDCRFAYLDQGLTYYRLNSGGLSANVEKQFNSWLRVYEKVASAHPDFAKRYGELAKAYQYRYLARRLLLEGNALNALDLLKKAFKADWSIIWREPARSISTLIATLSLCVLPSKIQQRIIQTFI